jgi:hypothetical protein
MFGFISPAPFPEERRNTFLSGILLFVMRFLSCAGGFFLLRRFSFVGHRKICLIEKKPPGSIFFTTPTSMEESQPHFFLERYELGSTVRFSQMRLPFSDGRK